MLRGTSPQEHSDADNLLMDCIQRAILDAFWSRLIAMVKGYARQVRKMLECSDIVGLSGPFRHTELMPWKDHSGYEVAVTMLLYSRRKGKHSENQMQFDTFRVFRTVYGNFIRASPQATFDQSSLGDNAD